MAPHCTWSGAKRRSLFSMRKRETHHQLHRSECHGISQCYLVPKPWTTHSFMLPKIHMSIRLLVNLGMVDPYGIFTLLQYLQQHLSGEVPMENLGMPGHSTPKKNPSVWSAFPPGHIQNPPFASRSWKLDLTRQDTRELSRVSNLTPPRPTDNN